MGPVSGADQGYGVAQGNDSAAAEEAVTAPIPTGAAPASPQAAPGSQQPPSQQAPGRQSPARQVPAQQIPAQQAPGPYATPADEQATAQYTTLSGQPAPQPSAAQQAQPGSQPSTGQPGPAVQPGTGQPSTGQPSPAAQPASSQPSTPPAAPGTYGYPDPVTYSPPAATPAPQYGAQYGTPQYGAQYGGTPAPGKGPGTGPGAGPSAGAGQNPATIDPNQAGAPSYGPFHGGQNDAYPTSGAAWDPTPTSGPTYPTSGAGTYPTSGAAPTSGVPTSGTGVHPTSGYPTSGPGTYPQFPTSGAANYPTSGPSNYPTSGAANYPTSGAANYPTSGPSTYPTSGGANYPTSGPADTDQYGLPPADPDRFALVPAKGDQNTDAERFGFESVQTFGGPRIEPTPKQPKGRFILPALAGLVVGLLLFGTGGWFLGRAMSDGSGGSTAADKPTTGGNRNLGPYESNQVALNAPKFSGELTTLAEGWLPRLSNCSRSGDKDGPTLANGEKVRVRCQFDAISMFFIEYNTPADRDRARVSSLGQNVDARALTPGVADAGSRKTPSGRTEGNYIEYAYQVDGRTVAGLWWDDYATPVGAFMLAYWDKDMGQKWDGVREVWGNCA
ncbi:hypothetical protein Aco04nite_76960 [Winogradskya consettensis]|uniref:Uncharacterized protein n=1 Tax=Winogradskya consettensis TaxID=113560 RepID=A0A919SZM7_9ACTN|nr:hypothetical protein Aco04nite_76960 [Actinoplanes consettensis]